MCVEQFFALFITMLQESRVGPTPFIGLREVIAPFECFGLKARLQ